MSGIYLDSFFQSIASISYQSYYDWRTLPNGCDMIGISFYTNDFKNHQKIVDHLKTKTKKLLVYVSEPTGEAEDFIRFLKNSQSSEIEIFSDIICNIDGLRYHTSISWFLSAENFYADLNWSKDLLSKLDHNLNKTKKFDCLLGSAKPHRDAISQLYEQSKYKDQIIYSYFRNDIQQGIWSHDIGHLKYTGEMIQFNGKNISLSSILPIEIYNQSYYSIIAETTFANEYSQFTEKVAKAILAKRPFIVVGGQYYLRNLRALGFKTFSNIIDEEYDNFKHYHTRCSFAWAEIEKLCGRDPVSVMAALSDVLEHNYHHFLETDWHQSLRQYLR